MKEITLAKTLIILNIFFILIYNSYFGWNVYPISEAEKICDKIVRLVDLVAIFFYVLPLVRLYESSIKKQEQ